MSYDLLQRLLRLYGPERAAGDALDPAQLLGAALAIQSDHAPYVEGLNPFPISSRDGIGFKLGWQRATTNPSHHRTSQQ